MLPARVVSRNDEISRWVAIEIRGSDRGSPFRSRGAHPDPETHDYELGLVLWPVPGKKRGAAGLRLLVGRVGRSPQAWTTAREGHLVVASADSGRVRSPYRAGCPGDPARFGVPVVATLTARKPDHTVRLRFDLALCAVTARADQTSCDDAEVACGVSHGTPGPPQSSCGHGRSGCSSQIQPLSHLPRVNLITISPVAQSVNPMSVTFSALMLAMASRSAMSAPRFMRAGLPAS